ncbi:hypothetical protein HYX04_00540 [Candidatus Woesearchaeota archaeon]|nr:hypothetical protein [Candidatus Woesearchaeota archaeon]
MGFLKFLKREKKDTLDELDLPPAPPVLEGFEGDMPELPDFPDFGDEKISAPKEEMPDFNFPEEEQNAPESKEDAMPEFPGFPEQEENPMPPIKPIKASFAVPETMPSMPEQEGIAEEQPAEKEQAIPPDAYPKIAGRLFSHEKMVLRERPSAKTIYVSVDNFKATLGSISMVRSDLRKSEESLVKLESIKNAKDKSFDRMKSSLDDLQRKLIFVDKTLFKDEGE